MHDDSSLFGQQQYAIRFEWSPTGAREVTADVSVIVDVLSFSTSVSIAVERGMRVFPFPWKDGRAKSFAEDHQAVLAVGRMDSAPSLSPSGLATCPTVPRLVLPSPNGSTLSANARDTGATIVAGCLRNAGAVASYLADRIRQGKTVAVIAAGERWRGDDTLRPSVEDQLGAGSILQGLVENGFGEMMSPESQVTASMFAAVQDDISDLLIRSSSGRELRDMGFIDDIRFAAEIDSSAVVPVLMDGAFSVA